MPAMPMATIRARFGVKAKRGGYVTPKPGQYMAGQTGKILRSDENGNLAVRNLGLREAWRGTYHPNDLTYIDRKTVRDRGFT